MNYREPFSPLCSTINKYSRGKLVLVVGSSRYTGAAVLAARASERLGAGYSEVITAPEALAIVREASPSLVVRPRCGWTASDIKPSTPEHPCAVCIGSGFEGSSEERALLHDVLSHAACPVLIDGGALSFVAEADIQQLIAQRTQNGLATVLTPHSGEAARIAAGIQGMPTQTEPQHYAQELATQVQCLVVLKGPDTYISDGVNTQAMTEGTPALAKAGTGDVLAGMIGALLAQNVQPFTAAVVGTTVHARAGRVAAGELSETAVVAADLITYVPEVLKAWK